MPTHTGSIIVFDGVCVLCNHWVDFILRHDRSGCFRLAPMQGRQGRALMEANGMSADNPGSLLLIEGKESFTDSDAITRVLRRLGGGWKLAAGVMRRVPRWARDRIYRWIARHRYRLFGKRATCRMPDPQQAWRFLD